MVEHDTEGETIGERMTAADSVKMFSKKNAIIKIEKPIQTGKQYLSQVTGSDGTIVLVIMNNLVKKNGQKS